MSLNVVDLSFRTKETEKTYGSSGESIKRTIVEEEDHLDTSSRRTVLSCSLCSYTSDRAGNLKRHVAVMHRNGSARLSCCSKFFTSKAALRKHTLSCHRITHTCNECGRLFERYSVLRRHMKSGACSRFACEECTFKTSQKFAYEKHKRYHQEVRRKEIFEPAVTQLPTVFCHSSSPDEVTRFAISPKTGHFFGGNISCVSWKEDQVLEYKLTTEDDFSDLPEMEKVAPEEVFYPSSSQGSPYRKQSSLDSLASSVSVSEDEVVPEPEYWRFHKKLRMSSRFQIS